jgi:DNA recombination protein RmuC
MSSTIFVLGALLAVAAAAATLLALTRARLARQLDGASKEAKEQQILNTKLQAQLDSKTETAEKALAEVVELRQDLVTERASRAAVEAEKARLETQLDEQQKHFAEKLALQQKSFDEQTRLAAEQSGREMARLTAAGEELKNAFDAMARRALESNNTSFLKLAEENLKNHQQNAAAELEAREKAVAQLVKPIGDSLKSVDAQIRAIEDQRIQSYGEIYKQLTLLESSQQALRGETGRLVQALRAPHVRGRWGELQLKRVVELAGMIDHCDFTEQESVTTESDKKLRPDMVIHLPGGRQIIVDAKTPLAAYIDATEATDEQTRKERLLSHAAQIRDHIAKLSAKSYWNQFPNSPEFVVMFLPGEVFFSAALEQMPELIEFGVQQKVIPASPTTLIALLRAVSYGWEQSKLAESAQKISELGQQIYERLTTMGKHFSSVGKNLKSAVSSYNDAVASLEARVFPAARKFPELGISIKGELPVLEPVEETARALQSPEWSGGDVAGNS